MDADLILSDARIDDHGRPVPLQPDTPTPAPALTDEQIDVNLKIIRDCAASLTRAVSAPGLVDRTVAAVVARAKREEREAAAEWLSARHDEATEADDDLGYIDGLYAAILALRERRYA